MNCDHLAILRDLRPFNGWERGRIDPLDFGTDLLNRSFDHLLAHNVAVRCHAEQHASAPLVEHGAHGLCRLLACSRRALELLRLGFTGRGQSRELFER